MRFPQLKNALLCRIFVYVVVLGGFIAPIIIVTNLDFVHLTIQIVVSAALVIALFIYVFKNLAFLMVIDIQLALLHCNNTARKWFALPESFAVKKVKKRISKFGQQCSPTAISPKPHMLRYKSNYPFTIYSSGNEKVIAV